MNNDHENDQSMARSTEQIANAGAADEGQYPLPDANAGAASEGQYPLPDANAGAADEGQYPLLGTSRERPVSGDLGTGSQPHAQLLEDRELEDILVQWKEIQAEFVDEPRQAVQNADALVAELMQRLAQTFAGEREEMESRWAGGDDVSTEDLRRGLRRYRSFFERLLAA